MGFLAKFDAYHETASKALGLDDFGPDSYREPLRLFLADLDRHSRFDEPGIAVTEVEIVTKLSGRLLVQQGLTRNPEFTRAPVERPLIILGMPRTGSTALHRLIARDPELQALELWLGMLPQPRPPRDQWETHPAYRQVADTVAHLVKMSPNLRDIHPLFADEPDECRFALDQSFWTTGMAWLAHVPEYLEWCLTTDATFAYRRYREVLSLVAGGDTRRWVLKNPDHIFGLDALLNVFPDASIVQTHRDPFVSLPSVASLSYEMMKARDHRRTALEHGKDSWMWIRGLEKAESIRAKGDPKQFFDLHINELKADPVGCVERIYRYFDLPVTDAALQAWHQRNSADPRSGHGIHEYRAADFGITQENIQRLAPRYCERYRRMATTK